MKPFLGFCPGDSDLAWRWDLPLSAPIFGRPMVRPCKYRASGGEQRSTDAGHPYGPAISISRIRVFVGAVREPPALRPRMITFIPAGGREGSSRPIAHFAPNAYGCGVGGFSVFIRPAPRLGVSFFARRAQAPVFTGQAIRGKTGPACLCVSVRRQVPNGAVLFGPFSCE